MAIRHAKSGEVIDIRPLGQQIQGKATSALVKTDTLEVVRLVLPAGTTIDRHQVPGEITVQCLEGEVVFDAADMEWELSPGDMLYLDGGTPHALQAVSDSSVLLTILLHHKASATEA